MPIFILKCNKCEFTQEKLIAVKDLKETVKCQKCTQGTLLRQLPRNISSITYETKDAHRGVQHRKGQKEMLTKRMREHHDRYEIEEKVDKFGLDAANKHGWVKKRKVI